MSTLSVTPEQLFAELPAHDFEDYASFEATLVEGFNRRRFDVPPGYGWRDALEWGLQSQVVRRQACASTAT